MRFTAGIELVSALWTRLYSVVFFVVHEPTTVTTNNAVYVVTHPAKLVIFPLGMTLVAGPEFTAGGTLISNHVAGAVIMHTTSGLVNQIAVNINAQSLD